MSRKRYLIESLSIKIRRSFHLENAEKNPLKRAGRVMYRWALMLYYESIKDDVKVRAESLAFLMVFSILPLIAGLFFIFTFFAQFGMVQEALTNFVNTFLERIPHEHRDTVTEYILKFKDTYLESIAGKSGKLGIFALAFMGWIGLSTFDNIDRTINHIWSSEMERPFFEKLRNFLVVSIAAPICIIASLSVPLILRNIHVGSGLVNEMTLFTRFLNTLIPLALVFFTFMFLYRYVPVRRVKWRAAFSGALFSAIFLQLANFGMALYFRVGTNSAYGKAAVLPLLGFWIYVVWVIVIVGAEVSYLTQNQNLLVRAGGNSATLYEAECLLGVLFALKENYIAGTGSRSFAELFQITHLDSLSLKRLLRFLLDRKMIVETADVRFDGESGYALGMDLSRIRIRDFLSEFLFDPRLQVSQASAAGFIETNLKMWLETFGDKSLADV